MSQGLVELRKVLFQDKARVSGTVAVVGINDISVATSTGLRIVNNTIGVQFQVGDRVMVEGNQLIGKIAAKAALPVYYV